MKPHVSDQRGAAAVEFAIALPVYVMIFFGILFLGQASFVDQEMNAARVYATFSPGPDTDADLNLHVLSNYVGQLNVHAKGRPAAAIPGQDADGDGEADRYVNVQKTRLSSDVQNPMPYQQQEEWHIPDRGWSSVADLNYGPSNVGPYSNFRHGYNDDDPQPGPNQLWVQGSQTILHYDYAPDFARFVYGGEQLTTEEYLKYQLVLGPEYTDDAGNFTSGSCRDCHASLVQGANHRYTARDYRGAQDMATFVPGENDEIRLWNQLKVKDMKVLVYGNQDIVSQPSDPAYDEYLAPCQDPSGMLPPADALVNDATSGAVILEKRDEWDRGYVKYYGEPDPLNPVSGPAPAPTP